MPAKLCIKSLALFEIHFFVLTPTLPLQCLIFYKFIKMRVEKKKTFSIVFDFLRFELKMRAKAAAAIKQVRKEEKKIKITKKNCYFTFFIEESLM